MTQEILRLFKQGDHKEESKHRSKIFHNYQHEITMPGKWCQSVFFRTPIWYNYVFILFNCIHNLNNSLKEIT